MRLNTVIALGFGLAVSAVFPTSLAVAIPLNVGAAGTAQPNPMIELAQRRVGARSFDAGQARYYPGQWGNKKQKRQQPPPQ